MSKYEVSTTAGLTLGLTIIIFGIVIYIWNSVKFLNCDFESDYKCEIVHGIGVIVPPLSVVSVWFDSDQEN